MGPAGLLLESRDWSFSCSSGLVFAGPGPSSFTVPSAGPGSPLSGERSPVLTEVLGTCFPRPWPCPAIALEGL